MRTSQIFKKALTVAVLLLNLFTLSCSDSDKVDRAERQTAKARAENASLREKLQVAEAKITEVQNKMNELELKKAEEMSDREQSLASEEARQMAAAESLAEAQQALDSAKSEYQEMLNTDDNTKKQFFQVLQNLEVRLEEQRRVIDDQQKKLTQYQIDADFRDLKDQAPIPVLITYHLRNVAHEKVINLRNQIREMNSKAAYAQAAKLVPAVVERTQKLFKDEVPDVVDSFLIETTAEQAIFLRNEIKKMVESRLVVVKGISRLNVSMNLAIFNRDGNEAFSKELGRVQIKDIDLSQFNIAEVSSYAFSTLDNQASCKILSAECLSRLVETGLLDSNKASWKEFGERKSGTVRDLLKSKIKTSLINISKLQETTVETDSSGNDAFQRLVESFRSTVKKAVEKARELYDETEEDDDIVSKIQISIKVSLIDSEDGNYVPIDDEYIENNSFFDQLGERIGINDAKILKQDKDKIVYALPVGQNERIETYSASNLLEHYNSLSTLLRALN